MGIVAIRLYLIIIIISINLMPRIYFLIPVFLLFLFIIFVLNYFLLTLLLLRTWIDTGAGKIFSLIFFLTILLLWFATCSLNQLATALARLIMQLLTGTEIQMKEGEKNWNNIYINKQTSKLEDYVLCTIENSLNFLTSYSVQGMIHTLISF